VTALAIGIGLTTSMFSIVNGTILRGLPFEESHELLNILTYKPEDGVTQPVAIQDFADWREGQTSFEDMAVWRKDLAFLRTPDGRAERYDAAYVSSNLFDLLRVKPFLGRSFEKEDSFPVRTGGRLSHGLWQNRFQSDPSVIGSAHHQWWHSGVVGTMPEDSFSLPRVLISLNTFIPDGTAGAATSSSGVLPTACPGKSQVSVRHRPKARLGIPRPIAVSTFWWGPISTKS
jgi:hypothetical protein